MIKGVESVTFEDLTILCKPSMINLFYERLIDYMVSTCKFSDEEFNNIASYRCLGYTTKVSLMHYIYNGWNAMFNDICNGSDAYTEFCDLLYTAINDYLG